MKVKFVYSNYSLRESFKIYKRKTRKGKLSISSAC